MTGLDRLPPLWHRFSFLDHPAQSGLGADGHPTDGRFLPPIPQRRRMFAGGRWRQRLPLRVGDEVSLRSAVTSIEPKTGRSGEMAFVTIRNEYSLGGELASVEEQDIVYRSEPPAESVEQTEQTEQLAQSGPRRDPDNSGADEPPAEHELTVEPDPTLLFRFSALTYNAHRIHYDRPYATGVEGYPGLVVHGPLLALLALELPRRHHRAAEVAEFRYRLRRPAFADRPVRARSWPVNGDGWCELAVGVAGGPAALTASARLAQPGEGS